MKRVRARNVLRAEATVVVAEAVVVAVAVVGGGGGGGGGGGAVAVAAGAEIIADVGNRPFPSDKLSRVQNPFRIERPFHELVQGPHFR